MVNLLVAEDDSTGSGIPKMVGNFAKYKSAKTWEPLRQ